MYKLLNKLHKFKNIHTKFIFIITLLCVIPILIIISFSYLALMKNLKEQINIRTLNYLTQSENLIKIALNPIDNSIMQLKLDKSFKEYETFYKGAYFENAKGADEIDDLTGLYNYENSKAIALSKLNSYTSVNSIVDSIYFYDSDKNIVLTSDGTSRSLNDFPDKEWLSYTKSLTYEPRVTKVRELAAAKGNKKQIITLLYKSDENDENNIFIVNVDINRLFRYIYEEINFRGNQSFFIFSSDGNEISRVGDNSLIINAQFRNNLLKHKENSGTFDIKINNTNYQCSFVKDNRLNFNFVTMVKLSDLYKGSNIIISMLIFSVMLLLLLIISLTTLSKKMMYNPLIGIVNYIKNKNNDKSPEHIENEFDFIKTNLLKTFDEYDVIKNKFELSLPAYKQNFINSLLEENIYDLSTIEERFRAFNIGLDVENLAIIIVSFDFSELLKRDINTSTDKYLISNIIDSSLAQQFNGVIIPIDINKFSIIINCTEDEYNNKLKTYSQDLKKTLEDKFSISFSINISNFCSNVLNLNTEYINLNKKIYTINNDSQDLSRANVSSIITNDHKSTEIAEKLPASDKKYKKYIEEIVRILKDDTLATTSLASIASQLNLSQAYLSKIFKETTGQNFGDFLTMMRINRSKELLQEMNLKVHEIGEMIGYTNSYYFIRLFKQYTGMTPGEYRKLYSNNHGPDDKNNKET